MEASQSPKAVDEQPAPAPDAPPTSNADTTPHAPEPKASKALSRPWSQIVKAEQSQGPTSAPTATHVPDPQAAAAASLIDEAPVPEPSPASVGRASPNAGPEKQNSSLEKPAEADSRPASATAESNSAEVCPFSASSTMWQ